MSVARIFIGLLAVISFVISSSVWAYDIPMKLDLPNDTIGASGSPAFYNEVKINMNDNTGRLQIKGSGDFFFEYGDSIYAGEKLFYKLVADYDSDGNISSGTVRIRGAIPDLGIPKVRDLMTAEIDEWNLHDDPNLWAFRTRNIVCTALFPFDCSTSESVYVLLPGSGFDGDFDNGKFISAGFAVTTVPLPAAAWLFGSALGLLGWARRRRQV